MSKEAAPITRRRARLTRQGQITVPKPIRDVLGARPGDEIEFVVKGSSMFIELRPRRSVLDFAGIAADAVGKIPDTAEELDKLIERGLATQATTWRASGPRP